MDEILDSLTNSFEVTKSTNNIYSKHPRFSQYKQKSDKQGDQNFRRSEFLKRQKQRRCDFIDHVRGLAVGEWTDDITEGSGHDHDEQKPESMDVVPEKFYPSRKYKNQLMLSEWLVEVPSDFSQEWLMLVCPNGKRNLLVAARGRTSCYSKSGYCIETFSSLLPGGSPQTNAGYTVLDCIFSAFNQTFYVLDIMCWNSHPVYDSETEFRFFWLYSKFQETAGLSTISNSNTYKLICVRSHSCTKQRIISALNDSEPNQVDGLLFYHKRTHYTFGTTPLVTWLKVPMIKKILDIDPPQEFLNIITEME